MIYSIYEWCSLWCAPGAGLRPYHGAGAALFRPHPDLGKARIKGEQAVVACLLPRVRGIVDAAVPNQVLTLVIDFEPVFKTQGLASTSARPLPEWRPCCCNT